MSWRSRVPEVLDALVALWAATPELAGVVRDGPIPVDSADLEVLSVGHDGDDDAAAVTGAVTPEGLGSRPDREQFTVACAIEVLNGAGDGRAARVRAFDLLAHASEALTGDRTLGGIVMRAHVQEMSFSQPQTESGAVARLVFTVACDAFTVR